MIWRLLAVIFLRLRATAWRIVYNTYRSRYDIHPSFRFNGPAIQLYGDGDIHAGENSYIGDLGTIQAVAGCSVTIGRDCSISHNVRIYTASNEADADLRLGPAPQISGSVTIGDGVWIGMNTFIGPGIAIGANAVVGANSVVTRAVPAGEIWGGVPARFIRCKQVVEANPVLAEQQGLQSR